MKRLPIYGLLITGYIIIMVGIFNLYDKLDVIQTVEVTHQETSIKMIPLLILSVFILIIMVSLGAYLIGALWKYFNEHKTLLPLPFILIGVGFLQFANSIMKSVSTMINSNAELFTSNLAIYTSAFNSLIVYTLIGIGFILTSVGYSFYLKLTA